MFDFGKSAAVRGSGHLILNVLRAFTIIALLCVAVSSWVMIVMTGIKNNFFFFDAASHFFTSCIAVFLTVSETGLFATWFQNNWPSFSVNHGLSWLGYAMVMLGCHILGNLNKDAISPENLGLPLWRLIMASGILSLTFGFFNVICSLVFRDGTNGITSRHIRKDGSLASPDTSIYDSSIHREKATSSDDDKKNRWTRRFTVFAGGKRPVISKPILHHDLERGETDSWDGNDRRSPILPDVKRPATALHPINSRTNRYSEASHLARFP
jgi:hypothetical protein